MRIHKAFHRWFSFYVFVHFMEKETSTKFYGVFDHLPRTYEIIKFLNG